jgi:hypothetical protein
MAHGLQLEFGEGGDFQNTEDPTAGTDCTFEAMFS